MIKKREKLNNSALAQIESGSSSRKFQQPTATNPTMPAATVGASSTTNAQNVSKIYNSKHLDSQNI